MNVSFLENLSQSTLKYEGTTFFIYKVENKEDPTHSFAIKSLNGLENNQEIIFFEKIANYDKKPQILPKYYGVCEGKFLDKQNAKHLIFDYYPNNLEDFIENESNQEEILFSIAKIYEFYKCLIKGFAFLQSIGVSHGGIKPKRLLFDENYQNIYISGFNQSVFIDDKKKEEIIKDDVFSFGLVLLGLGSLNFLEEGSKKIGKKIEESIEKFKKRYELSLKNSALRRKFDFLLASLEQCLNMENKERPDFKTLFLNLLNEDNEEFINCVCNHQKSQDPLTFSYKNSDEVEIKDLDILDPIQDGEGSFGTLYLAMNKTSKSQKYAIKTIPTLKKSEEDIKKEIAIWEKLQKSDKTRSIPRFYNSFREETSSKTRKNIEYHLIFDYFPTSLKKIISNLQITEDAGPFPLKKFIHFTKSLIHTLAYLQTLKVCHRDLKPDNFLVDEKCENIFVIDFGESKEVRHYATTLLTNVAGTPKYLSPELYRVYKSESEPNLKKIDFFRSDVFALGLVLLELGVLELPKREDDDEIYKKNIKKQILQFEKKYEVIAKMEDLETELEDLLIILRLCLKIERKDRPDFIELFLKMMEMWGKDDVEKIRKIILLSDHDSIKSEEDQTKILDSNIYEMILFSNLERLFLKKDKETLKNLFETISSKEFLKPLTEFANYGNKLKNSESLIKNFCFKLNCELSIEKYYDLMGEILTSELKPLRLICRLILYQLIIMKKKSSSEADKILKKKYSNDNFEQNPELIIHFINFIQNQGKNDKYKDNFALEESKFELLPNSQKKNSQSNNFLNYQKNNREEQLYQLINTIGKLFGRYSNEIDLDSKKSLEGTMVLYKDFEKTLQVLPKEKPEILLMQQSIHDLIENIEKIKTHTCYHPSPKVNCDICGQEQNKFLQIECMTNFSLESRQVFCKNCFKLILKSKFYSELRMPYLTLDCLEKERCYKRMIFTENSLQGYIEDRKELQEFLKVYNILRENYGRCFQCKIKWISTVIEKDDKMGILCNKCKKLTCKICWKEFHVEKLCEHLIKEYNPIYNLMGKILICPICYAISRKINQNEKIVKCENCQRMLCKFCNQTMDSIDFHGPSLHDGTCPEFSKNKKKNVGDNEDECQICEIRGTPCKQFSYRKFIGF